MADHDLTISALRKAVEFAPNNGDLVNHLCQTLLQFGRAAEAEEEYRRALHRLPDDRVLQLGLANCYYHQGKDSHALAIIETLESHRQMFPAALVLQARLQYRAGNVHSAVELYKSAIDEDPECGDEQFSSLLGLDADAEEDEVFEGRVRMSEGDLEDDDLPAEVERPEISFADVGGMESVKEEVRIKIIHPLQHADMFAAYGKKIGGGILLYGPPGCGKTHLARATAGEVNSCFISVGINDVLDMWIGNSERNLHELFESARRSQPCVIFFDEVDALGASRSDMRHSAGRHLINQFLSELDGADSTNEGLLVLGATNAPWHVDTAFRRPGRFDQIIFVPPPDPTARVEILAIQLQGKPQSDLDLAKVAAKTDGFSGADLKAVVDGAVETKLKEAIKSGKPTPITTKDLLGAVKRTKPSTREWFATARNHALYSNDGGSYDDILNYLKIKK